MKRLALFLLALPLWAVPPTVSNLSIDGLSHSVVRVHFDVSVPYLYLRFRYIRQADGICSGGSVALDHVQTISNDTPGSDPRGFFRQTDMTMGIGGLLAATPYNLCPEASTDNSAWSTGASIAFTTQALPAVHPALPIAPDTFDPGPPDYGTGLTACPTLSSTGYCIKLTTCANLLTDWRAAANNQASFGTIVELAPGTICTAITSILSDQFAPDIIPFGSNNINTSTGVITVPTLPGGFVTGTLVTFGTRGFLSNPSSTSCMSKDAFGGSFTYGVKYVATVLSSTTISLTCQDNGAPVVFGSAGTSPANFGFEFAPHYAATGNCPSANGTTPCTYYKRSMFWKVLRSAASDAELPPYPARITPAYCDTANKCATLQDPLSNVNNGSSTHWFINPNDQDGNVATMDGNTRYGPGLKISCENDPSQQPYGVLFVTTGFASDIVFDRTYIPCGGGTPQRWGGPSLPGGQVDGMNIAFVGNWLTNLTNWNTSPGIDSSSITSAAVGPVMLYNNHIECAGICFHFDGGSNSAGSLLRGSYSIIRNEFYIPLKYMIGSSTSDGFWYGNRQPLEFKQCWKCLIEGNYFNTTFNQNTGASAFVALTSVVGFGDRDVDLRNNIFAHGPGIASSPTNVDGGAPITLSPIRYGFSNNLGIDIDGSAYWSGSGSTAPTGRGWLFTGLQGTEDLTIEHNTIVVNVGAIASLFRFSDTNVEGVKTQNNFFTGFTSVDQGSSQEGSVQSNTCINLLGEAQMNCKFTGTNPAVIARNVFMSTDGSSQATMNGWLPTMKNVNFIPATMNAATVPGWQKYIAGTNATTGSYGLTPTSNFASNAATTSTTGPASDGTDLGINAVELGRAAGQVIISSNPVSPLASTTAQINFVAPDNLSCPVDWSTSAFPANGVSPTRVLDSGNTAGPRNVILTGLPAATLIHFTVQCAVEQPSGTFTTKATVGVLLQTLAGCSTAGSGGTDTTCIQNAFNSTAAASQILEMPAAGSGFYNANSLTAPSNLHLVMDAGASIKVVAGIGTGVPIITGDNNSNIIITGTPGSSLILGRKSEYTSDENRHCMRFAGSTNVLIDGISCNESGGDGIYIGEGTRGYAQNIEVRNSTFNHNSRNAMSIISCNICNVHDSTFSNTIGENGAAAGGPWAGIDIEPNVNTNRLVNITLTNLTFSGNGLSTDHGASNGNGLTVHFDLLDSVTTPAPVSITGTNLTSVNNVNAGFHMTNEHDTPGVLGPSGSITITSSHATGNGKYGTMAFFYDAGGPVFSYTNSTNANNCATGGLCSAADNADLAIERGGGAGNNMGGVHYTGDSVTSTNGNLQVYFGVEDNSAIGLANITIGSFGTLSGRTGSTNGVLNGSGVASVSIP